MTRTLAFLKDFVQNYVLAQSGIFSWDIQTIKKDINYLIQKQEKWKYRDVIFKEGMYGNRTDETIFESDEDDGEQDD